jgi:hypothetical protein
MVKLAAWWSPKEKPGQPGTPTLDEQCPRCGHLADSQLGNLSWLAAMNGIPPRGFTCEDQSEDGAVCGCAHLGF